MSSVGGERTWGSISANRELGDSRTLAMKPQRSVVFYVKGGRLSLEEWGLAQEGPS